MVSLGLMLLQSPLCLLGCPQQNPARVGMAGLGYHVAKKTKLLFPNPPPTVAQNENRYQKHHVNVSLLFPLFKPFCLPTLLTKESPHLRRDRHPVTSCSWPHQKGENLLSATGNARLSCASEVPGEKAVGMLLPFGSLGPPFSWGVQISA